MSSNGHNQDGSPQTGDRDAIEVCALLNEQQELLWRIYHDATEPPGKVMEKADLANFLFYHALHIRELAKTAVLLMESGRPYAVVLLGRSALESMFNLTAAVQDRQFGPQRIAFEYEEQARKLKFLLEKGAWLASRRPTPDECLREAERIRRDYAVAAPQNRHERNQIDKIERIAERAGLTPYYDDDYRFLSLTVHANQAGILNAMTGFLSRKAMIALCHATYLACQVLSGVFAIKTYDAELVEHEQRMTQLTKKPDHLPLDPKINN
jgi:hypothetical protein